MFDESLYSKVNLKDRTTINANDAAYKLITDENWNLIIPVTEDTNRQLLDAKTVRIKFKKDNTIVRVPFSTVEKGWCDISYLKLVKFHDPFCKRPLYRSRNII